jgi:hypothetical protein
LKKHKLRFSLRTANAQKQTNSAPLSFFRVRCRLAGRQKTTKPEKFRKFPRTFKSPKQSNLAPSANRSRCVVLCQKTLKKNEHKSWHTRLASDRRKQQPASWKRQNSSTFFCSSKPPRVGRKKPITQPPLYAYQRSTFPTAIFFVRLIKRKTYDTATLIDDDQTGCY